MRCGRCAACAEHVGGRLCRAGNARKRARGRGEFCLLETPLAHEGAIREAMAMEKGHGAHRGREVVKGCRGAPQVRVSSGERGTMLKSAGVGTICPSLSCHRRARGRGAGCAAIQA
jgi:hypothetical protein